MRNRIRNIILQFTAALTIFSTIIGCPDKSEADMREANDNQALYGLLMVIHSTRNHVLIDNQDGTVSLVTKDYFGKTTAAFSIYKKCAQGQLYRPPPDNDCRGGGTEADHWGAALLQYCSANDNSCNQTGDYVSGTGSEIYTSCANDTTAGLSWQPWSPLYRFLDISNFIHVFSDIPKDKEYWRAQRSRIEPIEKSSSVLIRADGSFDKNIRDFKVNKKYTLCSTNNQFDM